MALTIRHPTQRQLNVDYTELINDYTRANCDELIGLA